MAKAEYTVLGTSTPRMGGVERVIGAGIYGIDLELKGELHGGILRSQYAGKLVRFAGVDADNLRVGVLAAQYCALQLVFEHQVDAVYTLADDAVDAAHSCRAGADDSKFSFSHD